MLELYFQGADNKIMELDGEPSEVIMLALRTNQNLLIPIANVSSGWYDN
ncbi:MAG TPA: hypothetical protein GX503_03845 [Clostridiales bacterium]|nr:hypothetical protein [Clostridiales bacterium]